MYNSPPAVSYLSPLIVLLFVAPFPDFGEAEIRKFESTYVYVNAICVDAVCVSVR